MKTRIAGIILPLCLAAIGLSSCGGNNNSSNVLTIGMECDYAPFNWTESKANDYTLPIYNQSGKYADGYDIQISKYLGKELNREVRIVATGWKSLIPDLQLGSIDLVLAGMTDNEERRQSIAFTDEYYHSELVLVVSSSVSATYADTTVTATQFGDLIKDKVVISQFETVTDEMIDIFKDNYGAVHGQAVSTFALAATDVANGSAFAMTAELPVAKAIVAANSNLGLIHIDQTILGDSYAELGVSVGVRKTDTELCKQINSALTKLSAAQRLELMEAAVARSSAE